MGHGHGRLSAAPTELELRFVDMGNYITILWWGGDPDIPDPFSGMSRRDIYTVQRTWATVYTKSADYGMELSLRLFRKDPDTQTLFRSINGMPEDQVATTVVYKAHVLNLMSSLNTVVMNLNNPEVVAALANKLGASHHSKRAEPRHFEEFKEVLVDFFVNDLKLSEPTVGSWGRFIDFLYRHIYEKLKS